MASQKKKGLEDLLSGSCFVVMIGIFEGYSCEDDSSEGRSFEVMTASISE